MKIEKSKSGTSNNHREDNGVKVSKDTSKEVLNNMHIERMETEESFETVLSDDEECVLSNSSVKCTRKQNRIK
jgi:hypothetical protein